MDDRELVFPVKVEVKARGVVRNPPKEKEEEKNANNNRT